jgi:hypothetical protein
MSLKELFAAVTAAAVFCACVGFVGFDNVLFWSVAFVTLIVSTVWVAFIRRQRFVLAGLTPVPLMFFCGLSFSSAALFVDSLALAISAVVLANLRPTRLRTTVAVAFGCALVSFIVAIAVAVAARNNVRDLRREFPVIALAPRLSYERKPDDEHAPVTLAADVNRDLIDDEKNSYDPGMRRHMLVQIHSRQFEHFVRAQGFGVGRMIRPWPEYIRRPPLRDIPFDWPVRGVDDGDYREWADLTPPRNDAGVEFLHTVSRYDFLNPEAFGAKINSDIDADRQFVGFVPHAFHEPPATAPENPLAFRIQRLELVSLLKFEAPRVYVLDHLPRMDQLAGDDVPTRPLDEFETAALPRLRTAEDVVIDESASSTRMLGSLRAASQCLECHSVQRGELLGAFTYFLHPGVAAEPLTPSAAGR